MNEKEINEEYQLIIRLLRQKRLKEAHTHLLSLIGEKGEWVLRNRLEQLQTSYQYMLQYMRQGTEDPERHKLYQRILTETWEITEQARISLLDGVSTRFYQELHKNRKNMAVGYHMHDWLRVLEAFQDDLAVYELMPDNQQHLQEVLKRHENTNKHLFLTTWGSTAWSHEDAMDSKQILVSEQLSSNDRSFFISALTLSLQEYFDAYKFTWLLTAITIKNDIQSVQRALVGIALTLLRHPDKLELYPEISAQLTMLDEKYQLGKSLNMIYLQLLRAQETEIINKRINEEIIPEVIKKAQKLNRNRTFDIDDLSDENDFNPDWEKAIKDMEFENKLREMNDLQMEGLDINMSTFAQLKRFPFFTETCHWLLPFDTKRSDLIEWMPAHSPHSTNNILNMLLQSGLFCSSDKYSLCFLMSSMPEAQRQMMAANLANKEMEELMDSDRFESMKQYAQRPSVISNLYIQDLYRFYKLSQHHQELFDPFDQEIALHRIPALATILGKPELLKEVADYRVKKNHPLEAIDLYLQLINQQKADADIFQKIGYCYQKLKRYPEAIDSYSKADILKPDQLWTLRHLATCYRMNGQFSKALKYYQQVESIEPDNKSVIYYTGCCFTELKQYDEALNCFFKLDFMEADNVKYWRAIAWCSFLCGKQEQAKKYYDKILNMQPNASDYLNAGHIAWTAGQLEQATTFYGKAVMAYGSKDKFLEIFQNDKAWLLSQGISAQDIPFVLDMI